MSLFAHQQFNAFGTSAHFTISIHLFYPLTINSLKRARKFFTSSFSGDIITSCTHKQKHKFILNFSRLKSYISIALKTTTFVSAKAANQYHSEQHLNNIWIIEKKNTNTNHNNLSNRQYCLKHTWTTKTEPLIKRELERENKDKDQDLSAEEGLINEEEEEEEEVRDLQPKPLPDSASGQRKQQQQQDNWTDLCSLSQKSHQLISNSQASGRHKTAVFNGTNGSNQQELQQTFSDPSIRWV